MTLPRDEEIDAEAAAAIAMLRDIANGDDTPLWLRTSLNGLIDRMEINQQLLKEIGESINDDCATAINLVRTHLGKNRI